MIHYAEVESCAQRLMKDAPNRAVKRGSLFETIDFGTLYKRTISSIYNWASHFRESVIRIGKKCAHLVSLSTTTHTASCRDWIIGKPIKKSMVIFPYFLIRMRSVCNILASF